MNPSGRSPALFCVDKNVVSPSELACGPWSPGALHGGAVAALFAQLVEDRADTPGGHIARLALELLRPVPRAPLAVALTALRDGPRVARWDVTLHAGGELVARATALRVHPTTLELPAGAATRPQPPPAPEHGLAHHEVCAWASFNTRAIELRHADDAINMVGATAWVRLAVAVIDGHQPTAVARVAAAADLTSGIGACLPADRYRAVNADLTLHLKRPPAGEWIAIRAHTHIGSHATGTAHAQLYDADGQIGSATQTLVVQAARTS